MKPRINIITLGTKNLEGATKFYEYGLGFPKMDFDGNVSFFELNGSWLSLYPWELLAQDALVESASSGFRGFTLAHNVENEKQVVELLEKAKNAGATITKPAQKTEWSGFSGYFSDLDGHLWEIAYNPFFWPGPKDDDKNKVIASYEKIADWMDEHRSRTLFEKPYLDQAMSYLKSGAKVLDLGCGTGEPIGQYFLNNGFQVTGVDVSTKMLEIAKNRCSEIKFILGDMRSLNLNEKFDCIIAWHSYFHLSQDEQRAMFKTFSAHLHPGSILLFTTGPESGEVWSNNGGENLYHASLSPDEYKKLLIRHGFKLITHKIADPECGGATVWLARF